MKRFLIAIVVALFAAGCAGPAPERTATGTVLTPAKIDQYNPATGAPCTSRSGDDLTLSTSEGHYNIPLGTGKVIYPDGQGLGAQWCKIPFTKTVTSSDKTFIAQIGSGSVFVKSDDLFSANGVDLVSSGSSLSAG